MTLPVAVLGLADVQRARPSQPGATAVALQVQLYIGNLSAEWQEDTAFVEAMSKYGSLERAFVVRNAAGLSKVQYLSLHVVIAVLRLMSIATMHHVAVATHSWSGLHAGVWLRRVLASWLSPCL